MKTLVTGATGTIGSQLAAELLDRGVSIRAASRNPDALAAFARRGAETARLDLEDPASLEAGLDGIDRLFLVGPQNDPDFGDRVEPIVAAAARAGVAHIVRLSALGADPDASLPMARGHGVGESHVKAGEVAWTIVRPTFFQDNLINFAGDSIRSEGVFYGSSGDGASSYVSSADVARALAVILEDPSAHAGKTYTLTGPEALTADQLAALASEVLGREIRYVDVPPDTLAGGLAGMPGWVVESLVGFEAVKRQGWAAEVSPAVRELAGRDPETYRSFLERNRARLAKGQ